jgi:DNA-binding HxlR family transcriptional regulator
VSTETTWDDVPDPPPGREAQVTLREQLACPVTAVLHRLGDRWSAVVVRLLAERPHGFNELDRRIEGISRRMLTRTLRGLEEDGLVSRTPGTAATGRVEYALTARGRSLRDQLARLGLWAAGQPEPTP